MKFRLIVLTCISSDSNIIGLWFKVSKTLEKSSQTKAEALALSRCGNRSAVLPAFLQLN